ncbi:MAG TPA: NPCBM/NEW2 domain-containing protein [Nocardioides sp.]|nr:NPCBM/NEW2 domain-containing protein [Nocardioides sp.]
MASQPKAAAPAPAAAPVAQAAQAAPDQTYTVDDAVQGTADDQFTYNPGTPSTDWGHANGEGAPANPYDGTNSWADKSGDSASFTFTGTQITFYGITAPQHGIGALSIDGGQATNVDFYSTTRTGDVALWKSPVLAEGKHTLKLTWTGTKNAASSGTSIVVDRVTYTGQKPAPVTTPITVAPAGPGRTFDGVGAISGGGGNSRLLIDYPAKQRSQILDYLFKPGAGANLQILKLEIGGDANSTDGSEPSVEHTKGVVNCNAGYEFWLAEQAKERNPNIKLYGLAWTAPGWISDKNFWSQDTIDYLMTWMGCAKSHGLNIDYLGGWNERGYNVAWYENLHATLAKQYPGTQVVGDDSGWDEADAMATDPDFAKSIDIVAAHYSCSGGDGGNADSCSTTQNALNTGKPLWDSEQGSQDDNTGAGPLIRAFTRGYVDAKMTGLLNWPIIASAYPNLPYATVGMMVADQPWSGNYSVGQNTWVTAQVTQFVQPGWQFLDKASGYLGGQESNGTYVTLVSPDKADYSSVVETTTATLASKATFTVPANLATKTVHVWGTKVGSKDPAKDLVHLADVTPNAKGTFGYTLQPGWVYTFSTVSTKGSKTTVSSPARHQLALPYKDDFDGYAKGQEAKYFSDMQGSFEAQPCAAGRSGMCLQQMDPTIPINWQQDSDAFSLVGDPTWTDYKVQTDVEMKKAGTVELIGRAGTQTRPQGNQQGYYFQVSNKGDWTLLKSDDNGKRTVLTTGTVPALGTGTWHKLGIAFQGSTITPSIDGKDVISVQDSSYKAGQVAVGTTSYVTDQFDNLSVTSDTKAVAPAVLTVHPSAASVMRGHDVTVTAKFAVPSQGSGKAEGLNLSLNVPAGFVPTAQPQIYGVVEPGQSVTARWTLTAPTDATSTAAITAVASYAQKDVAHLLTKATSVQVVNPPAPTGNVDLTTQPFLTSTNGWGPVEVNQSVGGANAGDGKPLTINGTPYAKGFGTNSVSDIALYLGGNCTTFTSDVGIDDETNGGGTVTFSVTGDGKNLVTTPVIKGHQAATPLKVDVTGVQVLHLVVGDGGDTNQDDHGDWATPTLTCKG